MQEGVCTDYTALALTFGLQVFSLTGAARTGRLVAPTICLPHKDGGVPLSVLPKAQQASLSACSPHYPYFAKRQAGKL